MVLVDTSVWVEHLRRHRPLLAELLEHGVVLVHPFVIGELACGSLKNRAVVLSSLAELPASLCATEIETLGVIESRKLWGRGIGWIDAHLLASALLSNCDLWTLDERLSRTALAAGIKVYGGLAAS
jgi:predicted nucleic acid-binding protein